MPSGLVILLFVLVGAAAAYFAWQQKRARQMALARLASELGWFFYPEGVPQEAAGGDFLSSLLGLVTTVSDPAYHAFKVFDRGRARKSYNTLQGTVLLQAHGGQRQCQALAGDYRYTTGSGKHQQTHHFSYLLIELPGGPVPETIIRPEGFFDQFAGFVGFDDIDFESAEFSKAFHVKGADKRFAYDLCDPRMMEFLLKSQPGMMEIDRFHFCLADGAKRWSPEQFKQNLAWAIAFFDAWPRHVIDRLAPRAARLGVPGVPPAGAPGWEGRT